MEFDFSEPVDHLLDRLGLCSNRAFNTFIKTHKVEIIKVSDSALETRQEITVTSRETFIDSDKDSLLVDGEQVFIPRHLYLIFNKPVDVVCSRVSDSHKTVFDFLDPEIKSHPFYKNLHIAGRLDSDSRGLVLLTTNGKFSASLVSPESHVVKEYRILLKNPVSFEQQEDYIQAFKSGINLEACKKAGPFRTLPAELRFIRSLENPENTECFVRIQEGKFRQIRRMFSALGNEVKDLKRISIGEILLPENLSEGCIVFWIR